MKIVVFKGGIGNQLFQYCLIDHLEKRGYRVYYRDETIGHNGLEIHKYFNVSLKRLPHLSDFIYRKIRDKCPTIFRWLSTRDDVYDERKIRFDGYWQDLQYISKDVNIAFNDLPLNENNRNLLNKIRSSNSVSIHVRRGDYLKYPEIYGGICTELYYAKALAIIEERVPNPKFFVFSDDIDWCRETMKIADAEYVGWNKGNDSIYDMYLMSECKANIIANSTFSYWGAYLNKRKPKVVYPKMWFREDCGVKVPDIFPDYWIGI